MFVLLDVGWIRHPFPSSSFRLTSVDQIETLRKLGLTTVHYVPAKSVLPEEAAPQEARQADAAPLPPAGDMATAVPAPPSTTDAAIANDRDVLLAEQHGVLAECDQLFAVALGACRKLADAADADPAQAAASSLALVNDCIEKMLSYPEAALHLLSESAGERSALHAVNTMVLCLLLGRAQGMERGTLQTLGLAALLHDMGKLKLPTYLAQPASTWSDGDQERFESHVGGSVTLAERMQLSSAVLTAIAQHHEAADGTGFPLRLLGEEMSPAGRILALVNRYDNLCNPPVSAEALTPHEALSVLFAQFQSHFDPDTFSRFIRMLGVYPPGSIVQLLDDSYALVVSVNASRPLRPGVIVYQPHVPRSQALVLELEQVPLLGIRRSLRPAQLPRDALAYLSPRQRICYFFARAAETASVQGHR